LAAEMGNNYYNFVIEKGILDSLIINWHPMIMEIVNDLKNGISKNIVSFKFHDSLVKIIISTAKKFNIERVVLTGGCFQNKYLLEKAIDKLKQNNFKVYWHQRVPTNDGGISLGQIKYSSINRSLHPESDRS